MHAFQQISQSPYITLYSNNQKSSKDLYLGTILSEKIGDLQMQLGVYPESRVPIYIVYKAENFAELAQGKAEIVEFSDAFYSGTEKAIYIRSKDQVRENYLKILLHEYIHWYLDELIRGAPLWFHEGMATYLSGQMGYDRYLIYLKESLINPKSDLFRVGHKYPDDRADWSRFYLSSAMAVRYMQDRHELQWKRFWDAVAYSHKQGRSIRFSEAFVSSYRQNLWDFHQNFEAYSKRQGYLYLIIALNSFLFALLPFVMLAIARKRRRRMQLLPDLPLEQMDSPKSADSDQ